MSSEFIGDTRRTWKKKCCYATLVLMSLLRYVFVQFIRGLIDESIFKIWF